MNNFIFIFIFFSIVISGCAEQSRQESMDVTSEIRKQWDRFISYWEKEEVDKLAQMYSGDGVNVPPALKANIGRVEIAAFYEMLFSNHISSKYEHNIRTLYHETDNAIEYGDFNVEWIRNDSTEWTFKARSVTHWGRNSEDEWEIKLFLFNNPPDESPN